MDKRSEADPPEAIDTQPTGEDTPLVAEISGEYVARWDRLVSTTNWEKGRIICEWREALIEAEASPGCCTDEAWSRRAGPSAVPGTGRAHFFLLTHLLPPTRPQILNPKS